MRVLVMWEGSLYIRDRRQIRPQLLGALNTKSDVLVSPQTSLEVLLCISM